MDLTVRGVKIPVALLFIVFAWSSWIDINGLWVELPLFVYRLPEGWQLPAYFTVIIQLANIGPLCYGIISKVCGKKLKPAVETAAIYIIIAIGATSLILLAFLWDKTSMIGGVEHSTSLLVFTFFLSLVDCTSSVTFLPFMYQFQSSYMTSFYIGEGMSGLLPTIVAFIQGAGEYTCVNVTNNSTGNISSSIQPVSVPLLFPVQDFFITLFAMLVMSMVAFSILKYSSYCKSEYKLEPLNPSTSRSPDSYVKKSDENVANAEVDETTSLSALKSNAAILPNIDSSPNVTEPKIPFREFIFLLVLMACICGLANGVLPSVQTYSLLPYGHIYYSLAVKLSQLANPLACFIGFCALPRSRTLIGVLSLLTAASASYILTIASYSPLPPVQGPFAPIFMVLVWILFTAVVSYLKVLISNLLLVNGHTALFWLGVAIQIGSFCGAALTFVCVTVLQLLASSPNCVTQ